MQRTQRGRRRARQSLALLTVGLLIGAGGIVVMAEPALAGQGECPPGTIPAPAPGNEVWSDDNAAVYAGGGLLVDGNAAELEGLVVVSGGATFARTSGRVNVGTVGVGSQVRPTSGSTMLAVGGGLTVGPTTVLDVGANAFDPTGTALLGGNIEVGGAESPAYPAPEYELNNGLFHSGLGSAGALGAFAAWGTEIATASQELAALTSVGTTTLVSGAQVTFTGTGAAGVMQVFSLTAAEATAVSEIAFVNVADDAPVVINVVGGGSISFAHTYYSNDGVRADDFASPLFGMVAARTLWNFVDATAVTVGGSSQVLGSLLAPNASYDITASTNGRVYAGGDIHMHGDGNELHNYPWISAPFQCIPQPPPVTGSISLQKVLGEGADFVLPDESGLLPVFSGTLSCAVPRRLGRAVETWELRPPDVLVVYGLPVGATCQVAEDPPAASGGWAWQDPSWTIDGAPAASPVTFVVQPPEVQRLELVVTNALEVGGFVIRKEVVGDDAPDIPFSGSWTCLTSSGAAIANGSWTLSAGGQTPTIAAPVGAQCTVTENAPAPTDQGTWRSAIISPAAFTVADASAVVIVSVENTFDPGLAPTGSSPPITYVVLGCLSILSGAVLLTAARRRVRQG